VTVTNKVTNPYAPPDINRVKLLKGPPMAWVDANGVFYWAPSIADAPLTTRVSLRVEDTGTPPMGTTREFNVFVSRPSGPVLQPLVTTKGFALRVTADSGSYKVFSAYGEGDWALLTVTNTPDIMFVMDDPNLVDAQRFYRVLQKPSTPVLELPLTQVSPYPLSVTAFPGQFVIQSSDDQQRWTTLMETNSGTVKFEVIDTGNTNGGFRYKVTN
jgi:hypothetical protein